MGMIARLRARLGRRQIEPAVASEEINKLPGEESPKTSEVGYRPTPESRLDYLFRRLWVDSDRRQSVLDIREMDRTDGRVKKIHNKMSFSAVKGGLILDTSSGNKAIIREWDRFHKTLQLNDEEKLRSHARGFLVEGNLAMQWILNQAGEISDCARMPSETLLPQVAENGRFIKPEEAWHQMDVASGAIVARLALWQMTLGRLCPDNFDDWGSMGRPYMDASREVWQKLVMTEEDLVIRRHDRAAQRLAHSLEGADETELNKYREEIEGEPDKITTDFFSNRKLSVTAVGGDANLDQVADVNLLLDAFYACAPAPKGFFGYLEGLNRDILEDIKKDFFEEVDSVQDSQARVYDTGFRIYLLLKGKNPNAVNFKVNFAERRTDTPNQRADLALKLRALSLPNEMVWRAAGFDPSKVIKQLEAERRNKSPYPNGDEMGAPGRVSITPGNQRKGESATTIATRG